MKSQELNISGQLGIKVSRLFDQPTHLYYRGHLDIEALLSRPCVGVVGTRTPTAYGKSIVDKLVSELTRHNIVIVSGLALGIDCLAHQACLKTNGQTIAVLPSGIDRLYPSTNASVGRQIEDSGLLISEYSGDGSPRHDQFIARNRIIAALSDVLVIPEAADRSGSLHTARFALEMGIPVMAVPGPITSRLSEGCNRLIAQGATPILSAQDILRELEIDNPISTDYAPDTEAESKILEALNQGATDGAAIRLASGLTPELYLQTLTMLEIKGIIKALGGDQWGRL
jgi:DNA processing protein